MQVVAVAKSVRQSPRKIGLVASLVRGRSVEDAITILEHTPKRAALPIKKAIESAKANAENNHNMDASSLLVAELDIGPASSMKRYRPVAHGRAQPYKLRSTNIRVVVEGDEKAKKKPSSKASKDTKDAKKTDNKKTSSEDDAKVDAIENKKRTFRRTDSKKTDVNIAKQRTGRRGDR